LQSQQTKGLKVTKKKREFSSAGSEHLPYKQRVDGSNPSTPTNVLLNFFFFREFSSAGSEHLPYKQRVDGSNPSTPTQMLHHRMRLFFSVRYCHPVCQMTGRTKGSLAQLVQSICLTSRGSMVRIRQLPLRKLHHNDEAFFMSGTALPLSVSCSLNRIKLNAISVTPRIAFLHRMVLAVRKLSRTSDIRLLSIVNPFYRVRIGYLPAHYRLTKRALKGHQKDMYISIRY
jgi:hypothetical protein